MVPAPTVVKPQLKTGGNQQAMPTMRMTTGGNQPPAVMTTAQPERRWITGGNQSPDVMAGGNQPTSPVASQDYVPQTISAPTVRAVTGGNYKPTTISAPNVQAAQASASKDYSQWADVAMQSARRHLDPRFDQEEAAFRQRMVNQGLQEGTQAFDNAYANWFRNKNDAYNAAANQAFLTSQSVQNQDFQQSFQNAGLRQQAGLANASNSLQAQGLSMQDRQFGANLGFQQGRADMQDLMALLGYGREATQFNNNTLTDDQRRASAMFGLIPGLAPAPIDVQGASNSYTQASQAAADRDAANRNAQYNAWAQIAAAWLGG